MLNPFITPKLKNISVKPPDLVKNEVKVAEIVTPTKITQPEKVEHVTVEAKIEPIIVEEIKVKPTFLHISLGKFLYLLTSYEFIYSGMNSQAFQKFLFLVYCSY